jgi:UDP-N-acetylmuramoyl-tripeptide--D-alanyl-D-alanine ligase
MTVFELISRLLFVFALAWFVMTNLQYYGYRFDRLFFHHTKPKWLLFYLIVPILLYHIGGSYFWIFFYCIYLPLLIVWHSKLDKKLVITARVKRFLVLLTLSSSAFEAVYVLSEIQGSKEILASLIFSFCVSHIMETFIRTRFKKTAHKKLIDNKSLTVVALTASYGKTSIKHFLRDILSTSFRVYTTPGNVNTDIGICADINNNLPNDTDIYIVEAGARERGDILTIALLAEPHYVIVGKTGEQHIEYFKTTENIQSTKRELLVSPRMKKGIVHESTGVKPNDEIIILKDEDIKNVSATFEGTEWELMLNNRPIHLKTPVLGAFNALNISLAFLLAKEMGVKERSIVDAIAKLKNFEHRLQPIRTPYKLIIDDSYNGNLEGMIAACDLAATYGGRKVIVTPGIVESSKESNTALAKKINEVFDLALITGTLNADILAANIDHHKRKRVFDKRGLEMILTKESRTGDLVLFANDAPSFV